MLEFTTNVWEFLENEYKKGINYYKMEILESNEKHVQKHFNVL